MLEVARLSDRTAKFVAWGNLSWLSLFLALAMMFLTVSLGLAMRWPMSDRSQDQKQEQYKKVQQALVELPKLMGQDQVLNATWRLELAQKLALLEQFRDAQSPKTNTNPARDPLTFLGRMNLVVDDLQILMNLTGLLEQQKNLSEELAGIRTILDAKRYPDGSSAKGFQWASMGWLAEQKTMAGSNAVTWKSLQDGHVSWMSMSSQLISVENDFQAEIDEPRKNAAKDLLQLLGVQGRSDLIKLSDTLYAQVLLAKDRLSVSLQNFPEPEAAAVNSAQMWQWLIYPGAIEQGLWILGSVSFVLSLTLLGQKLSHRNGMRKIAQEWLSWSARQEVHIRKSIPNLESIQVVLVEVAQGLTGLAEEMDQARLSESASKNEPREGFAWQGVNQLKTDIHQYVVQIREKLLNIHTQFCSGGSRENLIYDMAFIAQALESVETSVSALNLQLDLMGQKSPDEELIIGQSLVQLWGEQVKEYRRQLRSMRKDLDSVHGLLDTLVEDVPQAKRFEQMPRYDASGRRIESPH
jgi:hypothetical protein